MVCYLCWHTLLIQHIILHVGVWPPYVRHIMYIIPMYADVHRRVDMRKRKVNVCLAEVHLFTIDVVYTNISKN